MGASSRGSVKQTHRQKCDELRCLVTTRNCGKSLDSRAPRVLLRWPATVHRRRGGNATSSRSDVRFGDMASNVQPELLLGVAPQVDGAVGSLIHWPLVLILLLGTLPGVVIVADTARRRRKRSQVEMVD